MMFWLFTAGYLLLALITFRIWFTQMINEMVRTGTARDGTGSDRRAVAGSSMLFGLLWPIILFCFIGYGVYLLVAFPTKLERAQRREAEVRARERNNAANQAAAHRLAKTYDLPTITDADPDTVGEPDGMRSAYEPVHFAHIEYVPTITNTDEVEHEPYEIHDGEGRIIRRDYGGFIPPIDTTSYAGDSGRFWSEPGRPVPGA
jgi:hypothetical protein